MTLSMEAAGSSWRAPRWACQATKSSPWRAALRAWRSLRRRTSSLARRRGAPSSSAWGGASHRRRSEAAASSAVSTLPRRLARLPTTRQTFGGGPSSSSTLMPWRLHLEPPPSLPSRALQLRERLSMGRRRRPPPAPLPTPPSPTAHPPVHSTRGRFLRGRERYQLRGRTWRRFRPSRGRTPVGGRWTRGRALVVMSGYDSWASRRRWPLETH
mmetsp:Transcript_104163/g.324818  ORF Transcript_104163/g.324818 Transcript_104163/m.324818 type:complete len:213 (-) Transcript_104163:2542-3180(-)